MNFVNETVLNTIGFLPKTKKPGGEVAPTKTTST
jgi:hypothetical protein